MTVRSNSQETFAPRIGERWFHPTRGTGTISRIGIAPQDYITLTFNDGSFIAYRTVAALHADGCTIVLVFT